MFLTTITIPLYGIHLFANLAIPPNPVGLVLFAHGSGSSRLSPRNEFVSHELQKKQMATLLVDLLTEQEAEVDEKTAELRFNIDLLATRLVQITDWLSQEPQTKALQIAYFGASTGAAAALIAAAQKGSSITSVVSRGGRPDLARLHLHKVQSPTLLIVGEYDSEVIAMNQEALKLLPCQKKLEIVPKASHLFEEPGALEQVARLSSNWFIKHFARSP